MSDASGDDIGDRMKAYEATEDRRFDGSLPIYARIDGRSFSRFTRGMERPFDADMSAAMVETASSLVERSHARIGYTQSDEISLVWRSAGPDSQVFFDGRVQKLCSVLSAMATVLFNRALLRSERLAPLADRLPHFDCRVVQLPSETEAANMLLWRELDASKNAISMAARARFSAKATHRKTGRQMLAMLAEAGVDFEAYPHAFRHGVFLRRETVQRALTAEEIAGIPEPHRPAPGMMFDRSHVVPIKMDSFRAQPDREALVFA